MFAASKSAKAAAAAATTDPSFKYVPLLLESTSTNGQQNNTFLDSSTNNFTITRNGTPTQGSVTPYWPNGQWGVYFDGSTSRLTTATSSAFDLSATNFTLEFWMYMTANPSGAYNRLITTGANGLTSSIAVQFSTSGQIFVSVIGPSGAGVTGPVIPLNTWTHVAFTLSTSTGTLYINGSQYAQTTGWSISSANGYFYVGYDTAGTVDAKYNGYVSNIRLVKGVVVYTGNFTPPTSPLAATQSAGTNISAITGTATSILTCQSNRFLDNSTNAFAITVNGTPKVQAFQPFSPTASYTTAAYGGSGYFNGTTDYLGCPSSAAFTFGTGNFTVEGWFYLNGLNSVADGIFVQGTSLFPSSTVNTVTFATLNTTNFQVYANGTNNNFSPAVAPVLNQWYHFAIVRNSGTTTAYLNGVSRLSIADSTNYTGTYFGIGNIYGFNGYLMNGYISNLRVVNGTAVYTGAFTPPTLAPLTTAGSTSAASYSSTTNVNTSFASSATSLLTNFTNAGIYDAAVQNNVITVGDAQASTTQSKWSPTSMKFDGTGDWLTAIDSPQLQLGTGDFTIDGWFYLSATGVIYGMVSKGTATTGWSVNVTVLNKLQFSYTTSNLTGATTLSASTWYYFAVVRSGSSTGNLKLYLNGTADATSGGAVTDNFNQTSILYVGADRVGATPLNGYLQDVRITKLARTITTPTAAFPTR